MKLHSIPTILLALSTAVMISCHKEKALSPGPTSYVNPNPTPTPTYNVASNLSAATVTDKVFYYLTPSTYPISCNSTYCTVRSRYVFHNDGSFSLQYNSDEGKEFLRGIEYKGKYTQPRNDSIYFTWQGWSVAGPWGSTAILKGDTLTVGYNLIMSLTDFEDAVYLRKQ